MHSVTSFPETLTNSARPRWSHRDPIEGGNPFKLHSQSHATWSRATAIAKDRLRHHDDQLNKRLTHTDDIQEYQSELVSLATTRFDIWAERGLAVIDSQPLYNKYIAWLHTYATNWLAYVDDTCPRISVKKILETRLAIRTKHWTTVAQSQLRHSPN
jgi:hypothetical protein